MKLKKLLLAALLSVGLSGPAFAAFDYVYIAGAPAFRQDSNNTINTIVTNAGGGLTATVATSTAAYINANQNQWLIPNYTPGVDLVISVAWTGSHSGLESVASGTITQKFIPDNTGSILTPTTSFASGSLVNKQPSITLSNTFQGTSQFLGTKTFKGPTNTTTFTNTYAALDQSAPLGVEPYAWYASPGFPVSNVTTAQLQALYKQGRQPLSFFTGNPSDSTKFVYGLTRDNGSGARSTTALELGLGLTTPLKTYRVTVTGGADNSGGNRVNGTYSGTPVLYPAGLIASTGIWNNTTGDTGYPSFGGANQNGLLLALTSNNAGTYYTITYFNANDASEASAAGAIALGFNGVPYSLSNLQEGKYTYWTYQYAYKTSSLSGNALSIYNAIVTNWIPTINEATVNVVRLSDSGLVIHK